MQDGLIEDLTGIEKSRSKVSQYFSIIGIAIGLISWIINYLNPSNVAATSFILIALGIIGVINYYSKIPYLGDGVILYVYLALIYTTSYLARSGATLSTSAIVIIMTIFYEDKRLPHFIFGLNVVAHCFFLGTGIMTFSQTLIQPYNIALVSNVQISMATNIMVYILTILIQNTLIKTIDVQKVQYRQLQDMQQIMLSQAQLDSIQLLAGGISHDFNNILTILTGNLSLMHYEEGLSPEMIQSIQETEEAAFKAKNLASQLLNLVREDHSLKDEIFDLTDLIEKTARFSLKGSASIPIYEIQKQLWGVTGDSMQISQVLQNLILNADRSMENPGKITIQAVNRTITNHPVLTEGNYVEIHVIDEGSGVPDEIKDQLFDLFFTTREGGSGIGLSISQNIIRNHGGYITFKNRPVKGSDFYFLLPAITQLPEENKQPLSKSIDKFKGTVLIYDDNKDLIKVLRRMLESMGITVHDASDSESFISLVKMLRDMGIVVDIYILDLILPGDIGGDEMVQIIRNLVEDPYIVVSSGYSAEFIVSRYKEYQFDNILRKPYTSEELKTLLADKLVPE